MDNPLVISLAVTGVGMLMLFLALAILYGLMYLMTWMTNIRAPIEERPEAGAEEQGSRGAEGQRSKGAEAERVMRRKAAAIAVALARAERELSSSGSPCPSGSPRPSGSPCPSGTPGAEGGAGPWRVSPWRALHHQRQLTRNPPARRIR
jgi:Na+-transporting methylmalonyl-CoA/oxaloacetate decarboxylase gamma subunit